MWTVSVFLLLLQSETEDASLCRRLLQAAQFEKQSLAYKRKQYMDRVIFMQRPRKHRAGAKNGPQMKRPEPNFHVDLSCWATSVSAQTCSGEGAGDPAARCHGDLDKFCSILRRITLKSSKFPTASSTTARLLSSSLRTVIHHKQFYFHWPTWTAV